MKAFCTAVFLVFISLFLALPLSAQHFFFEVAGGYGLPTSARYRMTQQLVVQDGVPTTIQGIDRLSFGPGVRVGATAGYFWNQNIGVALEGHYFSSINVEVNTLSSPDLTINSFFKATSFRLFPALIFQALPDAKFHPFAKIGPMLSFNTLTEDLEQQSMEGMLEETREYASSMSLGYQTKVGGVYQINDRIGIFGEVFLLAMVWSGTEVEVTSATLDGVDILDSYTTFERVTEIVDEIVFMDEIDPSMPSQMLRQAFHFTSLGLQVGLRYEIK